MSTMSTQTSSRFLFGSRTTAVTFCLAVNTARQRVATPRCRMMNAQRCARDTLSAKSVYKCREANARCVALKKISHQYLSEREYSLRNRSNRTYPIVDHHEYLHVIHLIAPKPRRENGK